MSDVSSLNSRPPSPAHHHPPEQLDTPRPYRFTWDPSSKPGPESVSGTTEGRGADYFNHQPVIGFLNTSSTNLASGSLPTEWSSTRHGFHAISTVLNNPHKRQAPPKAHSSLPSVAPASLPRVRRKDFDSYLHAIAPEWERFEHNIQLGREGQAQIEVADDTQITPRASLASDGTGGPLSPPLLRASSNSPLVQRKTIPPLDTVPSVFFDPKFNLADPRTFNAVTEHEPSTSSFSSPVNDHFSDPFALSQSLPLLEKFSHYADTVEQHLVREISIRSSSFFAALTNLHDLQSESEQCLNRIGRMRNLLKDVDTNQAIRGLEMVRKQLKRDNLTTVREGVKVVSGVVEMTGVARNLVSAGQWGEALDVIEEMERLWEGRKLEEAMVPPTNGRAERRKASRQPNGNGRISPLPATPEEQHEEELSQQQSSSLTSIPLSSLNAFAALPVHLRTLTMEIASSLSSELVSVLKSDFEGRILGDGSSSNESLGDRLKPLLQGLIRTKGLKEGVVSWREVVLGEVREVITKRLPSFDGEEDGVTGSSQNDSKSEGRAGLANHLRNMSHPDFILFIQSIYRSLLNGVEGLQVQGKIIMEILSAEKSQLRAPSAADIPNLEEDLADVLSSAAEFSNTQAAKVISYRTEQHAALPLADFLTFFEDSWAFVVKCEVICRRMIVSLRGTVVSQAKVFLQAFHQERISRSAKLVEDEQWGPCEVSPALQHVCDILVDSAVRDSPELKVHSDETIFSPAPASSFITPSLNGTPTSAQPQSTTQQVFATVAGRKSNGTSTKNLHIEERSYFIVSATAEVLNLVLDYLRIIVNLPMLTPDTMSRIIEFLKSFNSRTCQVVLGAGAMRSAGLRNITAKHLALASQSLSIVFELIPYVRETFRRHLSQTQAVMLVEFDKLKRDYQEHQNEIHSKLIAIMGDRLSAHIKTLHAVDWNIPKLDGVNEYMEILVKETVTLHKVLSRYLAAPVVEYVMTQVFAAINHRLSEEYAKIELPNQDAKTRLLADARYLHQKLSALRNVGAPTAMLETVVAEKVIPRVNNAPMPPTRSSTISSTNLRLKGLLSGKTTTVDKALPPVDRASATPPAAPEKTISPPFSMTSSGNGSNVFGTETSGSTSTLSLPASSSKEGSSSGSENAGFKQVEELPASNLSQEVLRKENSPETPQGMDNPPIPLPQGNQESVGGEEDHGS